MKSLVIAEKPSYARSIAEALMKDGEKFKRCDGYLESNKYIVTWAFGHLMRLYQIEEYPDVKSEVWEENILPYIPPNNEFKYKVKNDAGVQKQFNIIRELTEREDVFRMIHAGDLDSEGSAITNRLNRAFEELSSKRLEHKRLWATDQTPKAILESIHNLKDVSEYKNYDNSSTARTEMDFLFGINLTRKFTLMIRRKTGTRDMFPIGRCLTAIVNIVYDSEMDIRHFISKKYLQLESEVETNGEKIKLTDKDKFDIEDKESAIALGERLNNSQGKVLEITNKIIKKEPPKLFSLSKLQSLLSKKYKMTMKESLATVQYLYENGYVTYPRTDSEHLTSNEREKIKPVIEVLKKSGIGVEIHDKKRVFNDELVEAHSALIITDKEPQLEKLNKVQKAVYETIKNRFIANFLIEDTEVSQTIIEIGVDDRSFKLKGEMITKKGFYNYEPYPKGKDKIVLPKLNKGDIVNVQFEPITKKTTPPPKLTIPTLISTLENPFKSEYKDATDEFKALTEGVCIGTPATHAGLIENAKGYGYIIEDKGVLSITPKGEYLIETLNKTNMNLTKEKTVDFQKLLNKVFKNEMSVDECATITDKELRRIFNGINEGVIGVYKGAGDKDKEVIGICPKCGKNVYLSTKGTVYYCEAFRAEPPCEFKMYKDDKFFKSKGKSITKSIAKRLLANGQAHVTGLTSKDGSKKYSATVIMKINGKYTNFEMKFDK